MILSQFFLMRVFHSSQRPNYNNGSKLINLEESTLAPCRSVITILEVRASSVHATTNL
jgi:hypothetical protein